MKNFFDCPYGKRPERLSPQTRALAQRVLSGEYGRWLKESPFLLIEDNENFRRLSTVNQQLYCINRIANDAPIRIVEGEYLAGASTLDGARWHCIPVFMSEKSDDGSETSHQVFGSTSHLTCGFEKALKIGYKGLRKEIEESIHLHSLSDDADKEERLEFLNALNGCLDAAKIWHDRYMKALKERIASSMGPVKKRYTEIYNNLKNVPENPPENFKEAVQSLWFIFDFQRLCGNWPGIGRIDKMLGDYLKKDLESGSITVDEAREYIAHFWIKGAEWVDGTNEDTKIGSGDGQNYQNIILSGIDEYGRDVTNEVTYLVLDVVEELGISDFPISVRLRDDSDPKLFRRVAEIMKLGGGILAIYNENMVIDSLTRFGYSLSEARGFTNDGCWEVQVPGKTCFSYGSVDLLQTLQKDVLKMTDNAPSNLPYDTFDELFEAYSEASHKRIKEYVFDAAKNAIGHGEISLLVSLLTENCIADGKNYWSGGAVYNAYSPHAGGLPDVANALHAINQLVFCQKKLTLDEFVDILKSNWQDNEILRRFVRSKLTYYGNDDPEADAVMQRVFNDYTDYVSAYRSAEGYLHPAGISTFGRQIAWAGDRMATPDGHMAGEFLAHNIDPTPGTDINGATAVIKSYSKLDMKKLPGGTALTIKLLPSVIKGDEGTAALENILRGFIALNGFFLQTDVIDTAALLEAQKHPEQYESLSVRVSGWSARFNTLDKEWQDMVIQSTVQDI